VKPVSLLQACKDTRLLGGVHPLKGPQLKLLEAMGSPEMLALIAVGRQSGKSTAARLAAIHNACLRPDLDRVLPPSDERFILIAATDQEQARLTIRGAAGMVERSPLRSLLSEVTADQVVFRVRRDDGVRRVIIRAMPTRAAAVRGPSASLVIRDEAAHGMRDTGGPADERRIVEALNGTQTPFGTAAKQVWISTPFGEGGLFYETFRSAEAGALSSAVTLVASTPEMRPDLPREFFEAQRAQLGEDAYRQEYGAEWVSGGGSFFDLRGIPLEDGPARPEEGSGWVAGLDPAFHHDRFGVALVGQSVAERGVLLVGQVEGITPGARLLSLDRRRAREDRTLERVAEVIALYQPRIVTDQHQADAISSFFGRRGVSVRVVNLNGPVQTAAFTSTRTRIGDGSLRLWNDAQLIEELRRVRARDTETIMLPRFGGSHCDVASALALATWELRSVSDIVYGGRVRTFTGEADRRFPELDGGRSLAPGMPRSQSRRVRAGGVRDGRGRQGLFPPPNWPGSRGWIDR
jgi:hypothetical protein